MKIHFKQEGFWALRWGFLFGIAQILVCLLLAPHLDGIGLPFQRLNQWDSFHYQDIIERGYQVPPGPLVPADVHSNRANLGYFPAYPLFSKMVHQLMGVSVPLSMLLTAQIFCFLFWTQFFLLLYLWTASRSQALKGGATLACFPASFFLIAGYSESVFMAALMGLVLWTELWVYTTQMKKINRYGVLAMVFGFILTGTRLVGIPLTIYPLGRWLVLKGSSQSFSDGKRSFLQALGVSLGVGLGGVLFFGWCQLKFGQWDLYLKLQKLGWGNEPNYFAVLDPRSYVPRFFFEDTTNSVCRASNLFILSLALYCGKLETLGKKSFNRFALYGAAFCLFFVSLSGKANYSMDSMVRYNLPVFSLLLLALQYAFHEKKEELKGFWIPSRKAIFLGYLTAVVFQLWMIRLFTKGGWVA